MINMVGQRYGKLTVIGEAGRASDRQILWVCKCDCGGTRIVKGRDLRCGDVKSCGCIHKSYGAKHSRTRLYRIWGGMKARCTNPAHKSYKTYGGKGIKVCEEWASDFPKFKKWALSSGYQDGLSIDRIDPNGDYSPENCRWATPIQQANNTSRNHNICWRGETKSIAEWERALGFRKGVLANRIYKGWEIEKAFSTKQIF